MQEPSRLAIPPKDCLRYDELPTSSTKFAHIFAISPIYFPLAFTFHKDQYRWMDGEQQYDRQKNRRRNEEMKKSYSSEMKHTISTDKTAHSPLRSPHILFQGNLTIPPSNTALADPPAMQSNWRSMTHPYPEHINSRVHIKISIPWKSRRNSIASVETSIFQPCRGRSDA